MRRFSLAQSAAGEGQISQLEPLKGFTRFSFYSWQMDQKILRKHSGPAEAFSGLKKREETCKSVEFWKLRCLLTQFELNLYSVNQKKRNKHIL